MTKSTSRQGGDEQNISVSGPSDQPPGVETLPSCGDFDIRIARDGTWFYRGSPIGRKALVKLFSTVLRREDDGEYWLVTPAERGRVTVDDAPFTAVELSVSGSGPSQVLRFRTNVDDWVEAGPGHPVRVDHAPDSDGPSPYILVRDGLEALIVRSVYYHLVDLAVERNHEGKTVLGVWSKEIFFPLGSPD
ncbi:MAG: DUF1285 domain-containing protein [Kiloniellales bacterium]